MKRFKHEKKSGSAVTQDPELPFFTGGSSVKCLSSRQSQYIKKPQKVEFDAAHVIAEVKRQYAPMMPKSTLIGERGFCWGCDRHGMGIGGHLGAGELCGHIGQLCSCFVLYDVCFGCLGAYEYGTRSFQAQFRHQCEQRIMRAYPKLIDMGVCA